MTKSGQLKKIIPIMTRCFIFLRLQDYKTTRQQDYKFFWGNVEGRFFIVFKTQKLRNSEIQNLRTLEKIRVDT